jgi:hypothetical protein
VIPRTAAATAHGRFTATRLAWLASFFVTVALIALLGFVRSAQATPLLPSGPGAPSALLPFPEIEQLDDEAEETEEAEEEGEEELAEQWAECEELEEGEEQEACEEELEEQEEEEALEECTLSETESTVVANSAENTIHVAVHYRTYEPGTVAVQYRLRGGKGSLKLDRKTGHFSRRGVFRDTRHLAEAQMTKVLAAHQFTVEFHAVGAPDHCDGLFDEELRVKHSGGASRLWSD